MLRILIVAPACDGEDVSEGWVTYQWVSRLAARHDVTILTYSKRNATPLSKQLGVTARVVEWREPPALGKLERFNSLLMPAYVPFYFKARRWIRSAMQSGESFDIAHQFSPMAPRYPSPLAAYPIPYLLGPTGGSLESPAAFAGEEGTTPWYVKLRRLDQFRLRHDPLLRNSFERAACVLGFAEYVRDVLSVVAVKDFKVLSETGIESLPEPSPGSDRTRHVRLLFVGRLIRTKGVRDAVRAIALLPRGSVEFDVLGDGYDRQEVERLVTGLGLSDVVRIHGNVSRETVFDYYRRADIFLFPSYREPGGMATVEAMAHGLPVVVCNSGGPASVADDTSGIRVEASDPDQYARSLADAVAGLVRSPERRRTLGEGACRRIAEIGLWDSKILRLEQIYDEVLCAVERPES